ncbi:MAG: hypothetical protein RR250_05430 [Akkermansia sp.]
MPKFVIRACAKQPKKVNSAPAHSRTIHKVVSMAKNKSEEKRELEKKAPSFIKTNPAQEIAQVPKDAAYVSSRSTKASGGPKAPEDKKEMPSQDGIDGKDREIVLFDQARQDGAMDHESLGNPAQPPQTTSPQVAVNRFVKRLPQSVSSPQMPQPPQKAESPNLTDPSLPEQQKGRSDGNPDVSTPSPNTDNAVKTEQSKTPAKLTNQLPSQVDTSSPSQDREHRHGERDVPPHSETQPRDHQQAKTPDSKNVEQAPRPTETHSLTDALHEAERLTNVMPNNRVKTLPKAGARPLPSEALINPSVSIPIPRGVANASENASKSPTKTLNQKNKKQSQPIYDPMFSSSSQPGFRTAERKTRTTGKFSFGRTASMDVAATPMGRYQEIIYRTIGACWYAQCDRNRDLIVTGTLRIRIWINSRGKVSSMRLMSRDGASVAQNSFTFLAIRQAPIPPMPPEVVQELSGGTMELFFDFNF